MIASSRRVSGVHAPGRRPTPAYALVIFRRMGIPILAAGAALDLLLLALSRL